MAGYNRVVLMGNLTANPELRYTPQGTAVADVRLAVSTTRGSGEKRKEETLFIDCTAWARTAEVICEYMEKGRPILLEGRLTLDSWEDRETGQKRNKIKMVIDNFQFVGGGQGGGGQGGGGQGGGRARSGGQGGGGAAARGGSAPKPPRPAESFDDDFGGGDDIPF